MYIYQTMSNNFGYIDIILLGMIAGFIILRLRNILGRKTGHEPKIYPDFTEKKFNVPNNNIKSFKQIELIKMFLVIILGTAILALSSKIKIPFYPVPMTMQTFVVVLMGLVLGWKIGLLTIFLYIIEGLVGLPVFTGTPEKGVGLAYFVGPTMGYLIGFFAASFLASYIKIDDGYLVIFLKLTILHLVLM